jgi:protease-4
MAKFFKYLLATFLGGLLSGIVVIIIVIVLAASVVAAAIASGSETETIKDKTLFHLTLNGNIVERAGTNSIADLLEELSDVPPTEGLNQILSNIHKAANDKNISGILLDAGMINTGYATIEEIRNALIEFKKSGKFIYAYASVYSQKAYYLASAADKIYLTPGGMIEFKGLYSQHMYFKGALDKLGVEMQVFKVGKYKSAVEPYIGDKMSDASREQTQVYIDAIWDNVLTGISNARNIDISKLNDLANQMMMFQDPQKLVDSKMIDGLKYKDELLDELKVKMGYANKDDIRSIANKKYAKVAVDADNVMTIEDKIAVIYAEGGIDDGSSEGIQSEDLAKTIRKARRDSTIKAIVLRINSPGGSALGSEVIWREVKLAKETKPTVVSMGDYAASGGYYIACAADSIVAQPNTLTGSIGIFGMIPNAKGLLNTIGISFDGAKTNTYADMPAIERPFTEGERVLLQAYVERGYQTFTSRCADGRHTGQAFIDSIGQGRVWAGQSAVPINLVDKLGGIEDAIAIARRMAKLKEYDIIELPEIKDPFSQLFGEAANDAKSWAARQMLGDEAELIKTAQGLKNAYPIQARLPFELKVY